MPWSASSAQSPARPYVCKVIIRSSNTTSIKVSSQLNKPALQLRPAGMKHAARSGTSDIGGPRPSAATSTSKMNASVVALAVVLTVAGICVLLAKQRAHVPIASVHATVSSRGCVAADDQLCSQLWNPALGEAAHDCALSCFCKRLGNSVKETRDERKNFAIPYICRAGVPAVMSALGAGLDSLRSKQCFRGYLQPVGSTCCT